VVVGADPSDPFLCSQQRGAKVRPLSRHTLRRRFQTACRVLGLERINRLTIHHGRHTFVSHALAGGRTLAKVRPKDPSDTGVFGFRRGCYDFRFSAFGAG
jgi:integrase